MARWSRRDRALALSCIVASAALTGRAERANAQRPRGSNVTAAPSSSASGDAAEAQRHFQKGRELYKAGSYREAIVELEAALKLDPTGKELVYNLGVLHEKLGDIDDALKYFRQYALMDLTSEEREKTEAAVRRLEGAKKEIADKQKGADAGAQAPQPPPPPPTTNGRIDGLTIGAAGVSAAALIFGTVFALKASSSKPQSGFVTGHDGSYADLQARATSAHNQAIAADVGFGIGAVAGVAAICLYVLRPKEAPQPPVTGRTTSVSAGPLPGGGAIVVGGTF
jgi:tetratricopeptide (TPR) repeat protein